jgi:hypothetical protein
MSDKREIEFSSIKELNLCPRKYQKHYELHLAPKRSCSVALDFGTMLHTSRELLAKGNTLEDVLAVFDVDYDTAFDNWSSHDARIGQRTKLVGRCLIRAYAHKWADELTHDVATEIGFTVALSDTIYLRGKIDYIQNRSYGRIIADVKHTGSIQWLPYPKHNHQLTGYAVACEIMGLTRPTYVAVDGMILPHYNSSLFYPKEKSRTIQPPEEDLALTLIQSNLTYRESQLTQRDIDEWLLWLEDGVARIMHYVDMNHFPTNAPEACYTYGRACEYLVLCQARDADSEARLQDALFEHYEWHPYNDTTA